MQYVIIGIILLLAVILPRFNLGQVARNALNQYSAAKKALNGGGAAGGPTSPQVAPPPAKESWSDRIDKMVKQSWVTLLVQVLALAFVYALFPTEVGTIIKAAPALLLAYFLLPFLFWTVWPKGGVFFRGLLAFGSCGVFLLFFWLKADYWGKDVPEVSTVKSAIVEVLKPGTYRAKAEGPSGSFIAPTDRTFCLEKKANDKLEFSIPTGKWVEIRWRQLGQSGYTAPVRICAGCTDSAKLAVPQTTEWCLQSKESGPLEVSWFRNAY